MCSHVEHEGQARTDRQLMALERDSFDEGHEPGGLAK